MSAFTYFVASLKIPKYAIIIRKYDKYTTTSNIVFCTSYIIYPTIIMNVKEIQNQTNNRISSRNIPSHTLQPYISVHPVATKYNVLPLGDKRKHVHTALIQHPTYNTHNVFNPGDKAPWSGFNVNVETDMRLHTFTPNSSSDLFQYNFKPTMTTDMSQHKLLFKREIFQKTSVEKNDTNVFNNSTRVL